MEKADITPDVVARLVAEQFPRWADRPITRVALDGWDNSTFRLGEDLSARLPSAAAYIAQIAKEHQWLPVLARNLSLQIPQPVALGRPSAEFPRPWSIYRWIEGEPARMDRVANVTAFASDLARFLRELYAIDPRGGPRPGEHNFFRGGPVARYDTETRAAIAYMTDELDVEATTATWEAALSSPSDQRSVWVHGDVGPSNLLIVDGELSAVIDFGCAAVGDPACDLVMAWTFFTDESRATFRNTLALDDETWARARGWALWKALITLSEDRHGGRSAGEAARQFGWCIGARQVIDVVLADRNNAS